MRISDWSSDVCSSDLDTASRLPVVLQVLPSLEVGGGGVERSAIDVAEALALAGKKTIVASAGGRHVVDLERRGAIPISAERRVGTEGVSSCRSRWSSDH